MIRVAIFAKPIQCFLGKPMGILLRYASINYYKSIGYEDMWQ
jgi:hypothetical protein